MPQFLAVQFVSGGAEMRQQDASTN